MIAYFYFSAWPEAVAALPPEAEQRYTGPGAEDYWNVFADCWGKGGDLITIEQDVLLHSQVIPQLSTCPHDWCEYPWQVTDSMISSCWLGCTKFSARLQSHVPLSALCRPNPPELCPRCTQVPCNRDLDVIFPPLRDYLGVEYPAQHQPLVRHLRA